jgi:hypothetical protein
MRCGFQLAAWAAVAALCASAQTAPSPRQIAAHLTANDLKADVSFLASDALQGRGTPSFGLDAAAEYVASRFRRAGLEQAGDDGYFQTAAYVSVRPNLEGLDLTLEIAGQVVKPAKPAIWLQDPAAVDLDRAPAFKSLLGDPAALDALAPGEVRGKVLILDAAGGGTTLAGLRRFNASLARLQPALVILVRVGRAPSSANPQLRDASTISAVPVLAVFDEALRAALAGTKPGPLEATVSAHVAAPSVTPVKLRNVIGVLRGADAVLRDTYVVVTAHYDHLGVRGSGEGDHIYNGANDDASGTASVIEIADTLAALPRPKRTLVFMALFGEELGLLGSRYYAQHPIFPLSRTVADLNLEQMGRTDDDTGPRVGLVNVTGYDYTSITGVLRQAGQETGIGVVKDEESSDPFYARSDNQAFADAGVPAHTLSVGYVYPDYHQPGDKWPKLDYENMARVDGTIALAVLRLAESSEAPRWNTANPNTERYVRAREGSAARGAGSR